MAQYTISSETLTDIADAIRKKTKSTDAIQTKDMAEVIENFQGEGGINTSDATATASDVLSDKTAYVNGKKIVGAMPDNGTISSTMDGIVVKSIDIPAGYTDGGTIELDDTIDNEVEVQTDLISQITTALEGKASGSGGGIDTSDATATSADILSDKTAYVKGEKITGTIETKTSSNLSASGATVTVPAGYYANDVSKSVSSGSATTPATTITKNPTISINSSGLITASVSGTQNVTPTVTAGYVSSGTAGTITVSGSNTKQLTTQAAKTITPSTSSQTAVASGVYTTGAVTVNPIPSNYIIPGGTKTITTNGTHDVKSYASATVNVSGEDVTDETSVYTTKLTELETAITALETELEGKASGGGSDNGELKYITGEFEMSANGATVTGLEFTPKYVAAYCLHGFTPEEVSTYAQKAPVFVQGGLSTRAVAYMRNSTNIIETSSTSYANLDIIDNGFTIGTGTGFFSGTFVEAPWGYVAIG